jgi:short-subunit dehydrogenase involved in D-alanine esterification of teichoic acids
MLEPSEIFRLDNKIVVITGASSGIGRQCAITCSYMGAQVVLLGRDSNASTKPWSNFISPLSICSFLLILPTMIMFSK